MSSIQETTVVIIGAGVSGLTLATFLQKSGIACIVLEKHAREYVSVRQRAGVVEARGVRMFERWGLADKLLAGPVANMLEYRVNGVGRVFEIASEDGSGSRFCTQQMLVNNLLRVLIDEMAGDVRFEAKDAVIRNDEGSQPRVSYTDANGTHEILCDYIAGCDADRGISRASIPYPECNGGRAQRRSAQAQRGRLGCLLRAPEAEPLRKAWFPYARALARKIYWGGRCGKERPAEEGGSGRRAARAREETSALP